MDIDQEPKIYAYAIFIAIMIGIMAGTGALKSQIQKKVVVNYPCQERCKYETIKPEGDYLGAAKAEIQYVWKYYLDPNGFPERMFETQEECVDYCLRNK